MTTNAAFKKRVRARMAKTGEKYGAARRVLLEQRATRDPRAWVSEPEPSAVRQAEHSDAGIREQTGRGWDEWRDLIDAWPGHQEGHTAVAAWVHDVHGIEGWWAQAVTVGWERITGRRQPNQMADGTFTAQRSATITTDVAALRELLLGEEGRRDLFPGLETELRSRATSKNLRIALGGGVAEIAIAPKDGGRATITVAHAKLASADDVALWKGYWGDWLAALDGA